MTGRPASQAAFDGFRPAADPIIAAAPCGPVIDVAHTDDGTGTAVFSADRTHRYRLSRVWGTSSHGSHGSHDGGVCFLMLNPSTADAFQLDPTVRRCRGYATAWGHHRLEVVNIFSLRSTDPAALYTHPDPSGGDTNDQAIVAAAAAADVVVAAWGNHGALNGRAATVRALLAGVCEPQALKITGAGEPSHPLYLPKTTEPFPLPT